MVNQADPASSGLLDGSALARERTAFHDLIAANPPLVVQGTKAVLNQRCAVESDASLRYVAAWNTAFLPSHDPGEAVAAHRGKRPLTFEGR